MKTLNIDKLKKYELCNTKLTKQLNMELLRAVKKINRSQPEIYMNILKMIEAKGFKFAGAERT
ncbi:hypothetical protein [Paenibacillus prosopidis]|uniref:Uncharacterized protein n=1 Tax=Paenibacillus prosopidis TaxID=630520 RepID=A0A368W837_9BACL|nr:hypothetical protein [Paenibacillus prosopidis]RCW49435.1 hypothetical protein DFP97_10493 [Paenibacillus prosopidis]